MGLAPSPPRSPSRRLAANKRLIPFVDQRKYSTALRNTRSPSPGSRPSPRVQRGCCVGSMCRSGCGIRPQTRPVASHMPATSADRAVGIVGIGHVRLMARCPFAGRRRIAKHELAARVQLVEHSRVAGDELAFGVGHGQVHRLDAGEETRTSLPTRRKRHPAVFELARVVPGQRGRRSRRGVQRPTARPT